MFVLKDIATGKILKVGDKVKTFRGETFTITGMRPPHKPNSSGHVSVKRHGSKWECEYYPGVIDAKYELS